MDGVYKNIGIFLLLTKIEKNTAKSLPTEKCREESNLIYVIDRRYTLRHYPTT